MSNRPCTFCFCSKGYLDKRDEDRSAQERAHCSSYHSIEQAELVYEGVLFRFRRDPKSDMKFKCLCDSALSSTQSLFNHVKGSTTAAAKRRRVCDQVVRISKIVQSTRKPFRESTDPESEVFNAWPVEDAPATQRSDCCVPVVYDPPAQEEEASVCNSDESLRDLMLATLKALEEVKERLAKLENHHQSHEASLVELKTQVSALAENVTSSIASRSNV
ncbi:hypothetical protein BGZ73_004758 [Actinomortierella ambigua]|nr:hypothetical protein BGZ73_004758 [Actinomortierella ambigua]